MSATLKDLHHPSSAQIKSVLLSLRSSPKLLLLMAAAATLSVIIALFMWANQQSYALWVDQLIGQQQVVVKNLEQNYRKVGGVSGATILGDGSVALILDVVELASEQEVAA